MRLDKNDQSALSMTIGGTGYTPSLRDVECIAFSKPNPEGNKAVHAKANEHLLEVLRSNRPGHCIHITGEMRAMADPFHRRLCAELVKRTNARFTVIYDIPEGYRDSPEGVGNWNAQTWRSNSWIDKLSAMSVIGDAFVDVRAYNTNQEIQYSVFGNLYVLLQEKHSDEGGTMEPTAKRVWFLKSKKLNEFFTERALSIADKSTDIPETLFKRFSARVSGLTARNILAKLARNEGESPLENIVDEGMRAFDPDVERDLEALRTMGFIKIRPDDILILAAEGRQYLEAFK